MGSHGGEGILAHVDFDGPFRVGRYGVNPDDLERVGVRAIEEALRHSALVVMDEIGHMELCSEAFQTAVMLALDSRKPVLGTLQARSSDLLGAVRARRDVEIIELTEANRDGVAVVGEAPVAELLR